MAEVTLTGIGKAFGPVRVLDGIDLAVADGEFLTLVGPSGCGKSTLLRIIAGLERQDRGTVAIAGGPVDHLRPHERRVAMVFQSYALYPHMSVFHNIAMPLVMARLSLWERLPLLRHLSPRRRRVMREIARDVRAVAQQLQIESMLDRRPSQLSGGQRQRVALGRAMVRHPDAFLMDEPLSNLDAKLRVHMRAELAELHKRLGATFIYVTHDQVEAMTMSDRVAVMDRGELLQVGTPDALYDRPASLRVAQFIGSPAINVLPGRVGPAGDVEVMGRRLPVRIAAPEGTAVSVGVRPEALQLAPAVAADVLPARLRRVENLGAERILHLDLLDLPDTAVTCRVPVLPHADAAPPPLEGTLGLKIAAAACHLFGADGARIEPLAVDRMGAAVARLGRVG
jgi:multiple sugar transport system ATP-binding protein